MPTAKAALDYAGLTRRATEEADALAKANQPPTPPTLTTEQKAANLKELAEATYLYSALVDGHGPATFDVLSYKLLLDDFLREAGGPSDPVERLLLVQLFLAHHVLGRLHSQAGSRGTLVEVQAFQTAAARLLAEVRRTALALKAYRQRATDKQADVPAPRAEPKRARPVARTKARRRGGKKRTSRTKLGSKHRLNGHRHEHELAFG